MHPIGWLLIYKLEFWCFSSAWPRFSKVVSPSRYVSDVGICFFHLNPCLSVSACIHICVCPVLWSIELCDEGVEVVGGCRWCIEAWGQSACPWLTLSEPAALFPCLLPSLSPQWPRKHETTSVCVCVSKYVWLQEATENADCMHVSIFVTLCLCMLILLCVCGCESGCPGDAADILFSTGLPLQKRTKAFCPRL